MTVVTNTYAKLTLAFAAGGIALFLGCSPRAPLVNAAEEGDLVKVKALLQEGRSINERDRRIKFGWTPLMAAIYHHNQSVAHYLIAQGADVNLADNTGQTPLMLAIGGGDDQLGIVNDLIVHGADVKAKDGMGASVLSDAASDPPKPKILEAVKAAIVERDKTNTTN